jgi:tetratricopeptide (TPR) repeat protein
MKTPGERATGRLWRRVGRGLALLAALAGAPVAVAQVDDGAVMNVADLSDQPADVQRMVADGMGSALERLWQGGRNPREWQVLGLAYLNQAATAADGVSQGAALSAATSAYDRWIAFATRQFQMDRSPTTAVALARAYLEGGHLLLGRQAAPLLDEYELTAGQRGDRSALIRMLEGAAERYRKAGQTLAPLQDRAGKGDGQDAIDAAGLTEDVRAIALDAQFNLAWAQYYLATLLPTSARELARLHLKGAATGFQALRDSGADAMLAQIRLGAALVQRAEGGVAEAESALARLLNDESELPPALRGQVRFELARTMFEGWRFEQGREVLQPLARRLPSELTGEDLPLRYYVSLAKLWHARSYLLEADRMRKTGTGTNLDRATRVRENGLSQLQQLKTLGGSWPALVDLHIAASVNPDSEPESLGPLELLAAADMLMQQGKPERARRFLTSGIERRGVQTELHGDLLLALGRCERALGNMRAAANAWFILATQLREHPRAAEAAEWAAATLTEAAAASDKPDDYANLATALGKLVQAQPAHPRVGEIIWSQAVASQRAGRFADAAQAYGSIRPDDPRADEARFRQVACSRMLAVQQKDSIPPEEYKKRLRQAAELLVSFADKARQTPGGFAKRAGTLRWTAEALVEAAELYLESELADPAATVATLRDFERQFPSSVLLGHVFGLRIRAYRALGQLEQATQLVDEFLQTVPAEETAGVLGELGQGLIEVVLQRRDAGDFDGATRLATESIATFEQLERALTSRPKSEPADIELVRYGRARMLYFAGQYEKAVELLAGLRLRDPNNGNYQRLHAQLATAQLTPTAAPEAIRAAREAWAVLLSNPELATTSPEVYWESRFNLLELTLRLGERAEVVKAIRNERAWRPGLGGPAWESRFATLEQRAAGEADGK